MNSAFHPVRTCRGCHLRFLQKNLLRIGKSSQGSVIIDFDFRRSGRGVYLCRKIQCLKHVLPHKRKSPIAYFLKASIPDGFFDTLKKLYEGFSEESQSSST